MTKRALVLVALLIAGACGKDADPIVPTPCILVVNIAPDPVSVTVGNTVELTLNNATCMSPNTETSWTVSDPSIAKVIAVVGTHAWVSGLKGGVVVVTAMSKNDPNARDAVTLTVTQPAPDVGARPVPTGMEIKLPI